MATTQFVQELVQTTNNEKMIYHHLPFDLMWKAFPYLAVIMDIDVTDNAGIILGMGSSNERRYYIVMSPFIGWADTQNDPCNGISSRMLQKNSAIDVSHHTCKVLAINIKL